jgi:hypothetical protein
MDQLFSLLLSQQWLALSALVIGALVRVTKSDTPLPSWMHIDASKRAYLAVALGLASSVLDALLRGTPWPQAFMSGIAAALTAISGHELIVEGARKGREFGEKKAAPAPTDADKTDPA